MQEKISPRSAGGGRQPCEEIALDGIAQNRQALDRACIGWLDCLTDDCRWRTGPGADYPLYRPAAGGSRRCRRGARYRVFAVKTVKGELWCQITPPAGAADKAAPQIWVNAAGSGHLAKPAA